MALVLVEQIAGWCRITLGIDNGYHRKELVQELRKPHVTPQCACTQTSAIDDRTTYNPGELTQRKRKRVEAIYRGR